MFIVLQYHYPCDNLLFRNIQFSRRICLFQLVRTRTTQTRRMAITQLVLRQVYCIAIKSFPINCDPCSKSADFHLLISGEQKLGSICNFERLFIDDQITTSQNFRSIRPLVLLKWGNENRQTSSTDHNWLGMTLDSLPEVQTAGSAVVSTFPAGTYAIKCTKGMSGDLGKRTERY